jgi:hypothetical protein
VGQITRVNEIDERMSIVVVRRCAIALAKSGAERHPYFNHFFNPCGTQFHPATIFGEGRRRRSESTEKVLFCAVAAIASTFFELTPSGTLTLTAATRTAQLDGRYMQI